MFETSDFGRHVWSLKWLFLLDDLQKFQFLGTFLHTRPWLSGHRLPPMCSNSDLFMSRRLLDTTLHCVGRSRNSNERIRERLGTRDRDHAGPPPSKPRMQIFHAKVVRLWFWPLPYRRQIAWLPHSISRQKVSNATTTNWHQSQDNNSKYFHIGARCVVCFAT